MGRNLSKTLAKNLDALFDFLETKGTDPMPRNDYVPDIEEVDNDTAQEMYKTPSKGQYSVMAGGYFPSSRGVYQLPPGAYVLRQTPQGVGIFPHNFSTDDLIRLPDSKSDEVIAEVERFWTLKNVFKEYGFLHKRGFLLHGPPGTGKSCTINIVCADVIKKGGLVIMGDCRPEILSDVLNDIRQVEAERPIVVLLEDIDTIIQRFGESETLALLDGEYTIDHVVFVATTNYPENLDGRVVNRPSRFDRVVKIDVPSEAGRRVYLQSRLKAKAEQHNVDQWVDLTDGFSIAHLKELIVSVCCFGNDLVKETERLRKMFKTPTSEDDRDKKLGFGS